MGTINVYKMDHPRHYSAFLSKLSRCIDDDCIDIYFKDCKTLPAVCVPLAGTIDTLRKSGKTLNLHYSPQAYISNIHFEAPYKVSEHADSLSYPFSKIWKFNDFDEVTKLVNAFLDEIIAIVPCSHGLIEGLEWSLNEAMDNVLQHSLTQEGYMMGVAHKSTNYILFSIFDNGQGIFNSMRDSEYHPRNAIDAISIAIQEGKTRDKSVGQGNGLWGLHNIVLENKGKLIISSHGSSLMIRNDGTSEKFEKLPCISTKNATTSIDISFNYNNDISVSKALGGYVPSDIRYEDKLDDNNCFHFILTNESTGFGTRMAGERVRNKVLNYLKRVDTPTKINIDFEGVSLISSSFADEFIGKMIAELGFFRFTKLIVLTNVCNNVEVILNRSVSQRMAVLFPINEDVDDFE